MWAPACLTAMAIFMVSSSLSMLHGPAMMMNVSPILRPPTSITVFGLFSLAANLMLSMFFVLFCEFGADQSLDLEILWGGGNYGRLAPKIEEAAGGGRGG